MHNPRKNARMTPLGRAEWSGRGPSCVVLLIDGPNSRLSMKLATAVTAAAAAIWTNAKVPAVSAEAGR